jgi:hypothetical protein
MGAGRLVHVLLAATLAACSGDEPRETAGGSDPESPGVGEMLGMMAEVAVQGQWYRSEAKDMTSEQMLADLVAWADPPAGAEAADTAAIAAAEQRLGVDLGADYEALLRTPGALKALDWLTAAELENVGSLGDELAKKLRVSGDGWREERVLVESMDGDSERIPAGDFAGYVVVARPFMGGLVLYDPSPEAKHECCRILETPVLRSDTPTSYTSVHDWLVTEWALAKAAQ